MIRVTLKSYIQSLDEAGHENVPNLTDLAQALQISYSSISRFANNRHIERLNVRRITDIVHIFRRQGFRTLPTDIVNWDLSEFEEKDQELDKRDYEEGRLLMAQIRSGKARVIPFAEVLREEAA